MARSKLAASIAMLMVAFIIATPASAAELLTGTGTGLIRSVAITTVRSVDGNVIQERDLSGTVTGALQGTFVEHVRGVIDRTGHVTFKGTITFTGTVAGCGTGALTMAITGRGITGVPVTEAHIRVIHAASNTLAVHGVGTLEQNGPSLTYEVQYRC